MYVEGGGHQMIGQMDHFWDITHNYVFKFYFYLNKNLVVFNPVIVCCKTKRFKMSYKSEKWPVTN